MCKENCTEINLSSSVFNEMRDNFDAILKKALGNIVKGKSGQADINLKLTISATGENEGQLKPKFKHQVSSVMAIKERESGMVNPNAEMVYDEEEGEYVLRPVKSAQTTLFDTEEKDNEQPGSPESAPSAPVAMLGDGSEESKQGHENDAYNVKFGPFDADDYDIQARKAIVDLLHRHFERAALSTKAKSGDGDAGNPAAEVGKGPGCQWYGSKRNKKERNASKCH